MQNGSKINQKNLVFAIDKTKLLWYNTITARNKATRQGGTGQATGREGKMRHYQVIAFDRNTGAMDYTSKLLLWHEVNEEYFTASKKYTNHEIVIVVNE